MTVSDGVSASLWRERCDKETSMARLVKHDRQGPYKLDRDGETLWICGCGLSLDKPFCDATHLKTRDEEEGALYV
ncbi:MAG TPA: CDGSH iron-sulfur domain-containing protein [Methylomirabilota bacterium]|nr:CDGSH iron-sulfur domain-containing protein [Methylomirabilota bacterium]